MGSRQIETESLIFQRISVTATLLATSFPSDDDDEDEDKDDDDMMTRLIIMMVMMNMMIIYYHQHYPHHRYQIPHTLELTPVLNVNSS